MKPTIPYLLFTILLSLTTCKIDDGPQPCADTNTYHNLSIEEINITPYFTNPAFDTISFASNTGDTLTFALQKIDTSWYTVDENTNPNQQCGDYHHYQNITAKYATIKGNGSFEVMHELKNIISNNKIYINLQGVLIRFHDYWVGFQSYPTFKSSQNVLGRIYFNTIRIEMEPNLTFGDINRDYGLIQMKGNGTRSSIY